VTALKRYVRLEAEAEFRAAPDAPWQAVYVSFGKATLVIADFRDNPLAHWSLAATEARGTDRDRVLFAADPAMDEALAVSDPEMIAAIRTVTSDARRGAAPARRLRPLPVLLAIAVLAGAVWLATNRGGILRGQALARLPAERAELIDADIRARLSPPCDRAEGQAVLDRLAAALPGAPPVAVARIGRGGVAPLPGGTVLIDERRLSEPTASQAGLAGWIALGQAMGREGSAMPALLAAMPEGAVARLLLTGRLEDEALARLAAITGAGLPPPGQAALDRAVLRLEQAGISPVPFLADLAAVHPGLKAAPTGAGTVRALVPDQDWVLLQGICGP
jgi:hypothetical protein